MKINYLFKVLFFLSIGVLFIGCGNSNKSGNYSTVNSKNEPIDETIVTSNIVPTILSQNSFNVNENEQTTIYIVAVDEDNDSLSYSLNGEDSNSFEIDEISGEITFKESPNFEDKSLFNFSIRVSDGKNAVWQDIVINVNNQEEPFYLTANSFKLEENSASASIDFSEFIEGNNDNRELIYYIDGEWGANYFKIDTKTGVMTFKDASADAEAINSYPMQINIDNGEYIVREFIQVNITNINDNPHVIVNDSNTTVYEGYKEVFTVELNDSDHSYFDMNFSVSGVDSQYFEINSTSGELSLKQESNYEDKNSYTITVHAEDSKYSDSKDLNISVIDNSYVKVETILLKSTEYSHNALNIDIDNNYIAVGNNGYFDLVNRGYIELYELNTTSNNLTLLNTYKAPINGSYSAGHGWNIQVSGKYLVDLIMIDGKREINLFTFSNKGNIEKIGSIKAAENTHHFADELLFDNGYIVFSNVSENKVHIYRVDHSQDSNISFVGTIDDEYPSYGDFSHSLDLENSSIIISSHLGQKAEMVSVYQISEDNTSIYKLNDLETLIDDKSATFGESVAINENYIAVSAFKTAYGAYERGYVYLFERSEDKNNVTHIGTIIPNFDTNENYFGTTLDIVDNRVFITSEKQGVFIYSIEENNLLTLVDNIKAHEYSDYRAKFNGEILLIPKREMVSYDQWRNFEIDSAINVYTLDKN